MAGTNKKPGGTCPEGYEPVFDLLCIERNTLKKVEQATPMELPEIDLTNPACEISLAALKGAVELAEKAIEAPRRYIQIAEELVSKPFDSMRNMLRNVLGIFDEINNLIDTLLSGPGNVISQFRNALAKTLDCPFFADLPIAKTVASIIDAIDKGLPYRDLLMAFKSEFLSLGYSKIDEIESMPLAALDSLEKAYNDVIEKSGVGKLLKTVMDLYKCVEAVCDMIAIARRLPKSVEDMINGAGGFIDKVTGEVKFSFYRTMGNTAESAKALVNDLRVVRTTVGK